MCTHHNTLCKWCIHTLHHTSVCISLNFSMGLTIISLNSLNAFIMFLRWRPLCHVFVHWRAFKKPTNSKTTRLLALVTWVAYGCGWVKTERKGWKVLQSRPNSWAILLKLQSSVLLLTHCCSVNTLKINYVLLLHTPTQYITFVTYFFLFSNSFFLGGGVTCKKIKNPPLSPHPPTRFLTPHPETMSPTTPKPALPPPRPEERKNASHPSTG